MFEELSEWISLFIGLFGIFIAIILVLTSNVLSKMGTLIQKMDNMEKIVQRIPREPTSLSPNLFFTVLARDAKFWGKLFFQRADKVLIAGKIAANYIQKDETIIVDSGTTVDQIPHILHARQLKVKIYTNNLLAAISVIPAVEGFSCFLLSGKIDPFYGATYNSDNLKEILKPINADQIILSSTAITYDQGPLVQVLDRDNRLFKEALVEKSLGTEGPRLIIAVDWTKFRKSFSTDELTPVLGSPDWKAVRKTNRFILVATEPPNDLQTRDASIAREVIVDFKNNMESNGMKIEIYKV